MVPRPRFSSLVRPSLLGFEVSKGERVITFILSRYPSLAWSTYARQAGGIATDCSLVPTFLKPKLYPAGNCGYHGPAFLPLILSRSLSCSACTLYYTAKAFKSIILDDMVLIFTLHYYIITLSTELVESLKGT
jgi:hypothetical protein